MKTKHLIRTVMAIIILSLLSGCLVNYPKDLKLAQLSIVQVETQTGNEIDNGRYVTDSGDFFRLRLDVTSKVDVLKYSKNKNYLIDVNSFFCDKPGLNVLIKRGSLYWKKMDIDAMFIQPKSMIAREISGEIVYSIYLGLYSPAIPGVRKNLDGSFQNKYEAYDLVRDVEDVCVAITGRAMVDGFKSNIIRIDKGLIYEAVNKLNAFGGENRK